ncbi:MAG: DEAD/DEAH box helicase family protein [Chthoniobacterales bacterium]
MSAPYGHKLYQNEVLDSLRIYLRRCAETNDPARAFREVTEQLWGQESDYRAVSNLPEGVTMPPDMPFVCLRVPTGGGKTVIGARAIRVVRDEWMEQDAPVVLWLVPSEAIRSQTLRQMRDRKNPLRQALEEDLGHVEILDLAEALYTTRYALSGGASIIVSTIQAFRVQNTEGRRVYADNGSLLTHFEFIPQEVKARLPHGFPHSLANVLRLRRPLVIVDEAQNARTAESMVMLERFQPRCVLELTATPRETATATHSPSNVLHTVSAAELKAERMIKLPIVVDCQTGWKELLGSALAMRAELQAKAEEEEKTLGAPYLRPILLIQAEARSQQRETLSVEVVEKALREEFHLPQEQIAVATGERNDLPDNVMTRECKITAIITVQALREGWDCSWAYVLCSLGEVRSSIAAQQLLGRILREPDAQERASMELNRCYAFLRSPHFVVAAQPLRDHLINDDGFNEREAASFVAPLRPRQAELPMENGVSALPIQLTGEFREENLDLATRQQVRWSPETRTLTVRGIPGKAEEKQILKCLVNEVDQAQVEDAVQALRKAPRIMQSPADRGEQFAVPQLMILEQGRMVYPDESEFLNRAWKLPHPIEPGDVPILQGLREPHSVGILDVEDGRVITRVMPELQRELELLEVTENWPEARLITWLDRNIPHTDLPATETTVWIFGLLRRLQEEGNSLGGLVRDRFILRRALEQRIGSLRQRALRSHFQELLFDPKALHRIHVGPDHSFEYDRYAYPARWVCQRSGEFRKHYYEKVGELSERGEEFQCAQRLDTSPHVAWWVRNLSRQPEFSFWLQTSTDRFYPDFVCRLRDGRTLVVEYKNEKDWSNDDNVEKRTLGDLWAQQSGGRCAFFMPRGPKELPEIARWSAPQVAEELFDTDEVMDDTAPVRNLPSERSTVSLPEHSRVRFRKGFPESGVRPGERGTIVHVYKEGGYEVEVLTGRTRPAVVTVENEDVEATSEA